MLLHAGFGHAEPVQSTGRSAYRSHPGSFVSALRLDTVQVLQLLAAAGVRSEPFLESLGQLVERKPTWLLFEADHARLLLRCFRELQWWPEGPVSEALARLRQLEAGAAAARRHGRPRPGPDATDGSRAGMDGPVEIEGINQRRLS